MTFLKVETNLGSQSIDLVAKELVHVANRLKLPVVTTVEGVDVYVHPQDNWTLVAADFRLSKSNASVSSPRGEPEYAPGTCSVIPLRLQGGDTLHDTDSETYHKLKASGLLWELYPDAPDVFPSQNANMRLEERSAAE